MERNGNYKPSKAECNVTGLYLKEIGFSSLLTYKDEINVSLPQLRVTSSI